MADTSEDYERDETWRPGYWYSFDYTNIHEYKQACDSTPLVFLLNDIKTPKNCVYGINVHKMERADRMALLELMLEKLGGDTDDESAWDIDYEWFKHYFTDYVKGDHSALRFYNMKNVREPYRIKNKAIQKYICTEGHVIGENPGYQEIKHNLERNENA